MSDLGDINDTLNPVTTLCRLLDKNGVPYVFIRDASSIEEVVESGRGDIDMFCSSAALPSIGSTLKGMGWYNLFGGQTYVSMENDLVFDLYCERYTRLPMLTADEMLQGVHRVFSAQLEANLPLLADHVLLAVLLLHPLDLTGIRGQRSYTPGRQAVIYKLWNQVRTRALFLQWTRYHLGRGVAKQIERGMRQEIVGLPKQTNYLRLTMYAQKPLNLKYLFRRLANKVRPLPVHRGRIMAVMGVDGSGKSKLIEGLCDFVDCYYHKQGRARVLYMGRQGGFRLPLAAMGGIVRRLNVRVSTRMSNDPEAKATAHTSLGRRWVWTGAYLLEYGVRLLQLLYLVHVKQHIVICDRYVDDFAMAESAKLLNRVFCKFYPRPDHVLLIAGNVSTFHARKHEYTPDILEYMQTRIQAQLCARYPDRLSILDGNRDQNAVLIEALCRLSS